MRSEAPAPITSEEILRRLTIGDVRFCQALVAGAYPDAVGGLDVRSVALVRLGGSIAAGAAGPMLRQRVGDAQHAGVGFDEIVAALLALTPTVGIERIVAAAPHLSEALGYDVAGALETLDDGL